MGLLITQTKSLKIEVSFFLDLIAKFGVPGLQLMQIYGVQSLHSNPFFYVYVKGCAGMSSKVLIVSHGDATIRQKVLEIISQAAPHLWYSPYLIETRRKATYAGISIKLLRNSNIFHVKPIARCVNIHYRDTPLQALANPVIPLSSAHARFTYAC